MTITLSSLSAAPALQQLSDVRFRSSSAMCASAATQLFALWQQLSDVRFGSNSAT
jgi:hypothetical protein